MNKITLNSSAISCILAAMAILLVLASMAGQLSKFVLGNDHLKGLVPLFYVNSEQNIPTYFSMLLLLFAASLLAVIAVLVGKRKEPHTSKWTILSVGFLYMAFDEGFQVHERLVSPIRSLLGHGKLGFLYHAWVIPGIVLVFVLGFFFLRFLLYLPVTARLGFLVAGALYIGGAIGIETIGGRYSELHGAQNWTYSMIATVEESLEMAGLIVFIRALLNFVAGAFEEVRFRVEA